jgi:hypothetical protein
LSPNNLLEPLLELFLVKQLPACDAINLSTQLGDAILVCELLLLVARDQAGEHVLLEGEVGAGRERPAGHDHETADHDPERHRPKPDLPAGMTERVARSCRGRATPIRLRHTPRIGPKLGSPTLGQSTLP